MSNSDSGFKKFSVDGKGCKEIKVLHDTDLVFEVCTQIGGVMIIHKGKEVLIGLNDFKDEIKLRAILDEEFGYGFRDPLTKEITKTLQTNVNLSNRYEILVETLDNGRINIYITTSEEGIFYIGIGQNGYNKFTKWISSLDIKKIYNVEFHNIPKGSFNTKVVRIETYKGDEISGEIGEVVEMIKSRYGLELVDKFKMLLNQNFETIKGYYAIGPWFDGKTLTFATESLYNPPWKKPTKYVMPPEVSKDKVREVLERIVATVNSYNDKNLVTGVLCFGLSANFAHYFRQRARYFPHMILVGSAKTGKTTLTALTKYLYWGNNDLPDNKPKTEPETRRVISRSTLVAPIEDWSQLGNKNNHINEIFNALHSSVQGFYLNEVIASDERISGVFLSISSILADTNFYQELSNVSRDKILLIKLDTEEGIDVRMAEQTHGLLKNELVGSDSLHNVLHTVGVELIQIMAEKLRSFNPNKERQELLKSVMAKAYESWLDMFEKYGVKLTKTVYGAKEFPPPKLKAVESNTKEDLLSMLYEYIYSKVIEIPKDEAGFLKYGLYYFEENGKRQLIFSCSFIDEFIRKWLPSKKGINGLSRRDVMETVGLRYTTKKITSTVLHVYAMENPPIFN